MNRSLFCFVRPLCVVASLALTACSSMSGLDGGSRYACQAPVGVSCDSVSGVYANTVARTPPPKTDATAARPAAAPAPLATPVAAPYSAGTGMAMLPAPLVRTGDERFAPELPARTPPTILRLWIKPWEDRDGDLHDQAYVYVQIDSGRWRMEHVQQQLREASIPIHLPVAAGSTDRTPGSAQSRPATLPRPPASTTPAMGARP